MRMFRKTSAAATNVSESCYPEYTAGQMRLFFVTAVAQPLQSVVQTAAVVRSLSLGGVSCLACLPRYSHKSVTSCVLRCARREYFSPILYLGKFLCTWGWLLCSPWSWQPRSSVILSESYFFWCLVFLWCVSLMGRLACIELTKL